jgi:hypothetical protein
MFLFAQTNLQLRAVYITGYFGFHPGRRQSRRRRTHVRELVGEEAENLIARYDIMIWRAAQISSLRQGYKEAASDTRDAVLLRLANVYEDFMDGGMYLPLTVKGEFYTDSGVQEDILQLALLADWPELAELLEEIFAEFNAACNPGRPDIGTHRYRALLLPPTAARKLLPTALGWGARRVRRLFTPKQGL